MKGAFSLIMVMLLLVGCANAASPETQNLAIQEPWARPAKTGGNSAVYFTIDNTPGLDDRLIGAQCDAAQMIQVHMTTTGADGNSKMTHQDAVSIPAGETIRFEPGGLHIMLMNLTEDLVPGQTLPVTLVFEKLGKVQIEAAVLEP